MLILPNKINLFKQFKKFPKSRLVFVTLRATAKRKKYNLNTVKSWIGHHSDLYVIVRGLEGGEHYHLLAALKKKDWSPCGPKNVHMNIKYVDKSDEIIVIPTLEDIQNIERAKHFAEVKIMRKSKDLEVPYVCLKISHLISEYFRLKRNRDTRNKNKTRKESSLIRILDYLEKNLNENDDIITYITHYEKPLVLMV